MPFQQIPSLLFQGLYRKTCHKILCTYDTRSSKGYPFKNILGKSLQLKYLQLARLREYQIVSPFILFRGRCQLKISLLPLIIISIRECRESLRCLIRDIKSGICNKRQKDIRGAYPDGSFCNSELEEVQRAWARYQSSLTLRLVNGDPKLYPPLLQSRQTQHILMVIGVDEGERVPALLFLYGSDENDEKECVTLNLSSKAALDTQGRRFVNLSKYSSS